MRHHIIITGTGRAGTTFLMELFTSLGLDTGFDRSQFPFHEACRAGLEFDIRQPNAPYIVKDPQLCESLEEILSEGQIAIDHALIPMRDLFSAAESRRANVRTAREANPNVLPRSIKGGALGTNNLDEQERVLAQRFHRLMVTIARHRIPITLLSYPAFLADPETLYHQIPPPLQGPSYAAFLAAHKEVYRPDLVHDYQPSSASTSREISTPP